MAAGFPVRRSSTAPQKQLPLCSFSFCIVDSPSLVGPTQSVQLRPSSHRVPIKREILPGRLSPRCGSAHTCDVYADHSNLVSRIFALAELSCGQRAFWTLAV